MIIEEISVKVNWWQTVKKISKENLAEVGFEPTTSSLYHSKKDASLDPFPVAFWVVSMKLGVMILGYMLDSSDGIALDLNNEVVGLNPTSAKFSLLISFAKYIPQNDHFSSILILT